MAQNIIETVFIIIAQYLGGIEPAGIVLLISVGILAYLNRATLPTMFFAAFLLTGSMIAWGGIFLGIYAATAIAGGALLFLGGKQQFSR